MPLPTADEILTQQHKRYYYQIYGPGPENRVYYGGLDGQYLNIESVDNPQRGDISPINVGDPRRNKAYRRVGRKVSPPDFPTATINFLQAHGRGSDTERRREDRSPPARPRPRTA